MPLQVSHNAGGVDRTRHISESYRRLLRTMEKVSSGMKINRASDDPAGLVISEQLRSRIASLNKGIETTTLAIQKYNTADATISQLHSVAHGIRTMAAAAADGGLDDGTVRAAYEAAANRAVENYNHIVETAAFNNANLLDGSDGSLANLPRLDDLDLSSPEGASAALKLIDEAIARLNQAQIQIGSAQAYELEMRRSNLEITAENLTAAESEIRDTDFPEAMVEMIQSELALKAGLAILAHTNMTQQAVLSLLRE